MPTLINSFSLSSTVGIGTNTPNVNPGLTVAGSISASKSITAGGDINVYGTLYTFGSSIQLSSTNLVVGDPIIYFANNNNTSNNPWDIGIVGHFNDATNLVGYQHTGLIRNHLDNTWSLFSGVTSEPGTTLGFGDAYFKYDNFNVGYINSNTTSITSTGNAAVVTFKNKSTASGYIYGQNTYNGVSASTDLALFNDDGTAYVDVGITNTSYNGALYGPPFTVTGAKDGYLFTNTGANNLAIGTQNSSGNLLFFTGGTLSANERMRVLSTGNVGISTTSPNKTLTVVGDISATGAIVNATGNQPITISTSFEYLSTATGALCACFVVPANYYFVPNMLSPTFVYNKVTGDGSAVTRPPAVRLIRNGIGGGAGQVTNTYNLTLSANSTASLPQYFTQTPSYVTAAGGGVVGIPGDIIQMCVLSSYVGTSYSALTGRVLFYGSLIPV